MDSELKEYLDAWFARRERDFDNLMALMTALPSPVDHNNSIPTVSADGVVESVPANSGTAEFVTASAGLPDPPALVPTTVESPVVTPAVPFDTMAVVPATCSMDCATQDITVSTTATLMSCVSGSSPSSASPATPANNDLFSTEFATDIDDGEHGASLDIICDDTGADQQAPWPPPELKTRLAEGKTVRPCNDDEEITMHRMFAEVQRHGEVEWQPWPPPWRMWITSDWHMPRPRPRLQESHMPQFVDISSQQASAFLDPLFGPECSTTEIPIQISDTCSILKIFWSTTACSTRHLFPSVFPSKSRPVVKLELQITRSGSHFVYFQDVQMARSGIESAALNRVIIDTNLCRLKWPESVLTCLVAMSLYCSSFSNATEGGQMQVSDACSTGQLFPSGCSPIFTSAAFLDWTKELCGILMNVFELACHQNGQKHSDLLLLRWLLEQEELSIGFQLQQCIILVDWYQHNHRMLLRLDNMALMFSWRLIPTGKLCRNCKFAHSAIDRPTCFFPIQSVALKKMELWWVTIALLTDIVRMCTTGISRQLDVARSVHPTLLFIPAYQLCILAPTMFGFAWGSVDCISTSGTTSCALQITSSELRWFRVAFVGRQGLFQGGRHMPVYRHKELRLSWDPGGVAATCGQGSIGVIAVATFFEQGFAGHKYYRSFDQIRASDNYYPGDSFDWVPASHDYCYYLDEAHPNFGSYRDSGQMKDHRLLWDPGGFSVVSAWGQAEFQGGRDVRNLSYTHSYPGWSLGPPHGPGPGSNGAAHYKYLQGVNDQGIQKDHGTDGGTSSPT